MYSRMAQDFLTITQTLQLFSKFLTVLIHLYSYNGLIYESRLSA